MNAETNLEKRVRSIETLQAAQGASSKTTCESVEDHEARLRKIEEGS